MAWTALMAGVIFLNLVMAAAHLAAGDREQAVLMLGIACAWVFVVRKVRRGEWT